LNETMAQRLQRRRLRGRVPNRRAILLLPNLVTTSGLTLGFFSITQSIAQHFDAAVWAILGAGILDTMDGRIARATNSTTRFGVEYDSLADLICYGVAPSVLVYVWALEPLLGRRAWPLAALFAICAALRLARFNVQADVPRDHYLGIPSTAAGAIVSVTYWFIDWLAVPIGRGSQAGPLIAFGFSALALLMVSSVPYPSWKSFPVARRHAFSALVAAVVLLLLVALNGVPALFLLALLYLVSGIALHVRLRRGRLRAEAAASESDLAQSHGGGDGGR
jgi:CDP-diacylglycerol---serine O-phosphatidyltransferase